MNNGKFLTETSIKQALQHGYITKEEARQMLMVYLRQADFTPMSYASTRIANTGISKHR